MADDTKVAVKPATGHVGHVHTARCYWDLHHCTWVCRPAVEEADRQSSADAGDGQ